MQNSVFSSIIIPTYNQAHYLPAALDSLLAQTDADCEAIVVNDGSTDKTSEIAESYSRRDARIRCIHKPNGGVASALNAGLASARGEWIHWLSSDDMFEPTKLEINRHWIKQYPSTKFFFSYFTLLRDATGAREKRELWGPLPDPAHQLLTLFYRNFISGISICANREAWQSVGYFDESLRYAQDYDQWLRLLHRYQGRFISEWTVISRNHADQGSETFPDACYFDTAKAAIKFINKYSFKELLPWLDFTDKTAVRRAVSYALDVASDRTAFLYSLGAHPALILRIVEWVFSSDCNNSELRNLVRCRVAENSLAEGDDDWSWMWRQIAAAIHPERRACSYHPVDPLHLALSEYRQRRLRDEASADSLRNYLAKFESMAPEDLGVISMAGPRIAFLLEAGHSLEDYIPVLHRLAAMGARVLAVVLASQSSPIVWQQQPWGAIIGIEAYDRDCLPWLGEIELIVAAPGITIPLWLSGFAGIQLSQNETGDRAVDYINGAYFSKNTQRRSVIFLERVLWGGGAEHVVLDLVRYIDRQRYSPIILTMFDEHTDAPTLPSHVSTYNRHCFANSEVEVLDNKVHLSLRHLILSTLHHIYRLIFPAKIRTRLLLRQRIVCLQKMMLTRLTGSNVKPRTCHTSHIDNDKKNMDENSSSLDYVGAALHHNINAEAVVNVMAKHGEDSVLVAIMEEAAVAAWLAQAGRKFPYLVSLHSFESRCVADIYPVAARWRVERHWLSTACNSARVVTLPSDGCVMDMHRNFSVTNNNIRKMWNPIDCAAVRRLSFQQDANALDWRDQADGFRLIHVGRLDPQKNHDLLLDACVELKRRGRHISLAIVGEGHDRQRIEQQIAARHINREVTLIGERKNPFPWIKMADALVLTSHFEAFSLVLVEAMVCGTPTVSVDCPTGPAEVLANGEYGLMVPNYDPIALAEAIERLMDNPGLSKNLVAHGYERAESFDVKRIVKEWESLIDTVPHQN